ncbi:Cysteine and histidine-rich domain-containing protein RAR1 [Sesamum angolense]|uniref:Cysteine and histidine-rich domain-containing protein RAR1 n=1 Tax=Sesamum angolense TaxID=2727404 RepID=A0AAE1W1L6_9LAMI|nr:Cysteine and histidine-rich domain-containing protein RAR1 [Sesamum angolense]
MEKVRCQRIGCDAMFSEDDNPDGSCTYHHAPIFHDGMKEWSCCKKRSHDFNLFLEIPGGMIMSQWSIAVCLVFKDVGGLLCGI